MDETPEQKYNRISRAVQESILRNYPNPDRKGCPGDNVVREVAARADFKTDDVWEHITHCSPCYAIFLDHKQKLRSQKKIRRRTAILLIAAAASIPIVLITRSHSGSSGEVIGNWNLERASFSRGSGNPAQGSQTGQRAVRSRGQIRVALPLGSEAGQYQLEIRRSPEGPPLESAEGAALITKGHTELLFRVDLSKLPRGSYFAAIGRGDKTWRVYPLVLE